MDRRPRRLFTLRQLLSSPSQSSTELDRLPQGDLALMGRLPRERHGSPVVVQARSRRAATGSMHGRHATGRARIGVVAGLLGGLVGVAEGAAQQSKGWTESPFRPLGLPTPNALRTAAGRPGPDYWQQKVDYAIRARLTTDEHLLTGTETIRYHNRSPDTLAFLWLKLDANLCDPRSEAAVLSVPPLLFGDAVFDFSCQGGGGMTLEQVTMGGTPLRHDVYGTVARVDLPAPLPPGGIAAIEIAWRWPIPEYGFARMGRDGTLYQIASWYPRVAVYDDVRGWNVHPFLGAGEFYQEFGDFLVALTVPSGFVVTATGALENPQDVLAPTQRERLAQARHSDQAVAIITAEEARAGRDRRVGGEQTWRFAAENVRDFAFAMAPDFRWDASGWNGVLIQTFYRPEAALWEEANRMSWVSIKHFSERLVRYPWPHATTVEGPIGGMEYPMITFVPRGVAREDLYWVLTHEFGHEWFPMIVNSNERLYFWFDEGLNTFLNIGSVEEYFAGEAYGDTVDVQPLHLYERHAVPGAEQPMGLPPDEQHDLYWAAYFKPALMLHLLRTEVLGPERFDRAFAEYAAAWSFKHPQPADFFRFMENAAGKDLAWFWRGWIYTAARLDQAITRVVPGTDTTEWAVHLRNQSAMVMPVELALRFDGGEVETVRLPVEMWKLGPEFVYRIPGGRRLVGAEIDPRGVYPDGNRDNNVWGR